MYLALDPPLLYYFNIGPGHLSSALLIPLATILKNSSKLINLDLLSCHQSKSANYPWFLALCDANFCLFPTSWLRRTLPSLPHSRKLVTLLCGSLMRIIFLVEVCKTTGNNCAPYCANTDATMWTSLWQISRPFTDHRILPKLSCEGGGNEQGYKARKHLVATRES